MTSARYIQRLTIGCILLMLLSWGLASESRAASISVLSGNNQSGAINSQIANPLVVTVDCTNLAFVPIPPPCGTVAWTTNVPGDTFNPTPSNTTPSNTTSSVTSQSSTTLTLGSTSGPRTITATSAVLPSGSNSVTFSITGIAPIITIASGNNQSGTVNTALPSLLVVSVTQGGAPVPNGTAVTWTVTSGGGRFATGTTTTSGGQASNTLTLGPTVGAQTVTASVAGGGSITFTENAAAPNTPTLAVASGNNQSGTVNTALPSPFVLTVTQNGSPAPDGTPVTWAVTAGGGSLSKGATTTTSGGQTSNTLTLGPSAGAQAVTASVAGGSTVTFTVNGGTFSATVGLAPAAQAVAGALDSACAAAKSGSPLSTLCNQIAQLPLGERQSALQQLAPTQISAQAPAALQAQLVQTSNINARIVALRAGASGLSTNGLSFNVAGNVLPAAKFVTLVQGPESGGGASTDEPSRFSRLGVFLNGQVAFGDQNRTNREPGFDARTQGITGGVDYRFTDRFILGGAAGYMRTKSEFDLSAGDLKARGYTLSAFGTYYVSNEFYMDGILTYGRNSYDSRRKIVFSGFDASAAGDTDGAQRAAGLSTGYNFHRGGLTFGPTARVNYVNVYVDGFEEKDAGAASLKIGSQRITSLTTDLGGQVSYSVSRPWGVLLPTLRLEWEHQHRNSGRLISGTFVADPVQTVFAIPTDDPDRDYFNVGVGLSATFTANRTAFLNYETIVGRSRVSSHLFTAGVRIEF